MTRNEPEKNPYDITHEEAEAILNANPDATLVMDYLCGPLNDQELAAFRLRMSTDDEFRAFAEDRIAMTEMVREAMGPPTMEDLRSELEAMREKLPPSDREGVDSALAALKKSRSLEEFKRIWPEE